MTLRVYGPSTLGLVVLVARSAAASCTTDDPGGTRVLAAREQVQTDCPCDQTDPPAVNHGQYVSCAADVANMRAALDPSDPKFLPKTCKGAVKKCAAKSVCGKPGFVTCCITNEKSVTKCKTRKDTASCAAKNGIVGVCTSCCDACPSPGSGPSCPAPTTTTSTTTSTTTTLPHPALRFTAVTGTADCGSAGLTSPPSAPLSGEVDSDTVGTSKIVDLGLGCLYLGGGNATIVPPGRYPNGWATFYAITGPGTLGGSPGTGRNDCSVGAGAGRRCVNDNAMPACTTDGDCGGAPGACALDANCYFGPPLGIPAPGVFHAGSLCVLHVMQSDASGAFDSTAGTINLSLALSSRAYVTGNSAAPCPQCLSGTCDPAWRDYAAGMSPDAGAPCAAVGIEKASLDCRPDLDTYQAALSLPVALTTGTASTTAADGNFCSSQNTSGAFGQTAAQRIAETGSPAGDLGDGLSHDAALASVFCVPATGNAAVDGILAVPGPAALSLNGNAQVTP